MTATITRPPTLPTPVRIAALVIAARTGMVGDRDGRPVVHTDDDHLDLDVSDLVAAHPDLLMRVEGDDCAWWELAGAAGLRVEDRPEVVAAAVRARAVAVVGDRVIQYGPGGLPVADVTAVVAADRTQDGRDGRTPQFGEVGVGGVRLIVPAEVTA